MPRQFGAAVEGSSECGSGPCRPAPLGRCSGRGHMTPTPATRTASNNRVATAAEVMLVLAAVPGEGLGVQRIEGASPELPTSHVSRRRADCIGRRTNIADANARLEAPDYAYQAADRRDRSNSTPSGAWSASRLGPSSGRRESATRRTWSGQKILISRARHIWQDVARGSSEREPSRPHEILRRILLKSPPLQATFWSYKTTS